MQNPDPTAGVVRGVVGDRCMSDLYRFTIIKTVYFWGSLIVRRLMYQEVQLRLVFFATRIERLS